MNPDATLHEDLDSVLKIYQNVLEDTDVARERALIERCSTKKVESETDKKLLVIQ